jgi:hypothetical protein
MEASVQGLKSEQRARETIRRVTRLLTADEAAVLLKISVFTLKHWRTKKYRAGPKFVKLGTSVRYRLWHLMEYLEQQTVRPRARKGRG